MSEKGFLLNCAMEGFALLQPYIRGVDSTRFSLTRFPVITEPLSNTSHKYFYSNNADVFYTYLAVLLDTRDTANWARLLGGNDVHANLRSSLQFLDKGKDFDNQFERDLSANVARYSSLSDSEIQNEFSGKFIFDGKDLMDLPENESIFFSKVNHGYWEYMRAVYDIPKQGQSKFRSIELPSKVRRLRTSGVTQAWGWQIAQYLSNLNIPDSKQKIALHVSLTPGTEHPLISINKPLNDVTRGAAVGLLSMFESVSSDGRPYLVGDGSNTRDLIEKKQLMGFFEKYIVGTEACLFVTPPHLKDIDFVNYDGERYKFILPPTLINETWVSVTAALLGYLARLCEKHASITILTQGASIASLVSLLLADMQVFRNTKIRFFDLGRVLDVTFPEMLQTQAWAMQNKDAYVAEGRKVFRQVASNNFVLASTV